MECSRHQAGGRKLCPLLWETSPAARLIQHPRLRTCRASGRRFACLGPGWVPSSSRPNHPTSLSGDPYGTRVVLKRCSFARVCVVVCILGQTSTKPCCTDCTAVSQKCLAACRVPVPAAAAVGVMPSKDRRTGVQGDSTARTHGAVVW